MSTKAVNVNVKKIILIISNNNIQFLTEEIVYNVKITNGKKNINSNKAINQVRS